MASCRRISYEAADVRCPFYKSHGREQISIRCEGCCEGADLISSFRTMEKRQRHMGIYCTGRYENCPVYMCTYKAKYDD